MKLARPTALIGVVATSILVAACGGSSPKQQPTKTASTSADVKFSQCMRSHGLSNFPDVIPNQGLPIQHEADGSIDIMVKGKLQPVNASAFNTAMNACSRDAVNFVGHQVGAGTVSDIQKAMVQTAACMRRHGVPNYPDPPALGGGGTHLSPTGQARSAGIDVDSPAFKTAVAKCGWITANALNGK
jgi:hypothetical protein